MSGGRAINVPSFPPTLTPSINATLSQVDKRLVVNGIISGLSEPVENNDATTKSYVDTAVVTTSTASSWKNPVIVATTANITLSGTQTIDGVAVVAGNRILVKDQTNGVENGLYVVATGTWTRTTDLAAGSSAAGVAVVVQQGNVNANLSFICTNSSGSDVVGTDALVWTEFSNNATITWKSPVHVATTLNITLSGSQVIDGVSVITGYRVLVKDQTTGTENGIYVVSSTGAWSRSNDLLINSSAASNAIIVNQGTVSANRVYICTNNLGSDIVGTNALIWALLTASAVASGATTNIQYNNAGSFAGSPGLTWTNGTNRLMVTDGTNAIPSTNLHISSSGTSGNVPTLTTGTVALLQNTTTTATDSILNILSGNAANSILQFGDTDLAARGILDYNHTADRLDVSAHSVEMFSSGQATTATTYGNTFIRSVFKQIPFTSISTAANNVWNVAQVVGDGFYIERDCNGANRTDTFPSATEIVNAIPNPQIGSGFSITVKNSTTTSNSVTFSGTSLTFSPDGVVRSNQIAEFTFIVTNVGTPAVSVYNKINQTGLINIQEITTSGTYTPTVGTRQFLVHCVGGGGAGGGASNGINKSCGAGGGSGGIRTGLFNIVPGSTGTVTIGSGGTGVSAGTGNSGNDSTFVYDGATLTGNGGAGGGTDQSNNGRFISARIPAISGTTGASSNLVYSVSMYGNYSGIGHISTTSDVTRSGYGGGTPWGRGGDDVGNNGGSGSSNGNAGTGIGAGGSGGYQTDNGGAHSGGAGADGGVIIYEYA